MSRVCVGILLALGLASSGASAGELRAQRFSVRADSLWSPTQLSVKKGTTYQFTPAYGSRWVDLWLPSGPEGSDHVVMGLGYFRGKLRVQTLEGRRIPFFALIGTIGRNTDHAFLIGRGCTWTCPEDGELFCFANDWPDKYGNNKGSIEVVVTWTEP